jgi:outer membrane protein assembly factor BamD (BamD/ComL family)
MRCAALVAAVVLAPLVGCASLWPGREDTSLGSRSPGAPYSLSDQDSSDESKGLTWSDLSFENLGKTAKRLTGNGTNKELARDLYRQADDLFKQALAAPPESRARIFEMAGPKFMAAANRWPDSQLAMDAMYMAGECYFFSDNYPQANLCYEKLVKAFPNNRYLDAVDKRRFAIARYWLDVNHESPEPFYYVNWTNKTRPWRDIRGHGLRVFDKIRIDDPTGKLADDATLAAGNEYFATNKFYKADEYYTDLRQAYPTSEHQFLAHFLGIKSKLNSYLGPAYGGTMLDETEKLIKQTRRQFPQEAEREREFLDRALAEVRFRKAEQLMHLAQFYDRRSEYRAAEHYYVRLVREFRDTPLAARAEERVGQIAGLPPVPAQPLPWLVALFPESDKVKPLLEASEADRIAKAEQASRELNEEMARERDFGQEPSMASGVMSNFFNR